MVEIPPVVETTLAMTIFATQAGASSFFDPRSSILDPRSSTFDLRSSDPRPFFRSQTLYSAAMILAGIDEAGYGPLLGPLVVGCCAFCVADADPAVDELPCLWKRLKKLVGKTRCRQGKKLHVNDSKQVYSPSVGLKELERAVLTIATAWRDWTPDLDAFVARVAGHATADLAGYPWYASSTGQPFPISNEALSLQLTANALRAEMARGGAVCVHMAARVVCEGQFNRMADATRNKSSVLFSTAAIHLDYLLRTFSDQGLVIFCDRQGGREHYGQLLMQMFDDWSLEITREGDGHSEYLLRRRATVDGATHTVRIIFCEKAEAQCMPVAIASMLSKYLREALMGRFNAWWRTHLPDVAPTAGYYGDGSRFLQDIALKRRDLGITDAMLVRSR
jgi:hypothetical protein